MAPRCLQRSLRWTRCDDANNNAKLVRELADKDDKHVQYRCVIASARPGEEPLSWDGTFEGQFQAEAAGEGGFGYDPHVYLPEFDKTVAEISAEDKHARSHRGQAHAGLRRMVPPKRWR